MKPPEVFWQTGALDASQERGTLVNGIAIHRSSLIEQPGATRLRRISRNCKIAVLGRTKKAITTKGTKVHEGKALSSDCSNSGIR